MPRKKLVEAGVTRVTISMDPELQEILKLTAKANRQSVSHLVRDILYYWLEKGDKRREKA